jgi:hypothetical protein
LNWEAEADIDLSMSRVQIRLTFLALFCAQIVYAPCAFAGPHDALIAKHAAVNGVPESLIRRVIQIESSGNARAANNGNFGLMQIRLGTARAMGYRGTAQGLLDADTNLTYAVKYLAGAYRAAGCNESRAVSYYQSGYYGARRAKCPTPKLPATQVAERREQNDLAVKSDAWEQRAAIAAAAVPEERASEAGDLLTPRVVQTQTISKPRPELRREQKPEPAAPRLAATKTDPVQVPQAQTVAAAPRVEPKHAPEPPADPDSGPVRSSSPPREMTLKDFLTRPIVRPKSEAVPSPKGRIARLTTEPAAEPSVDGNADAATSETPEVVSALRAPPAADMTRPKTPVAKSVAAAPVAVLDVESVPLPVAKPAFAPEQEDKEANPIQSRKQKHTWSGRAARDPERTTAVQHQFVTPERPSRRRAPAAQTDLPERHRP